MKQSPSEPSEETTHADALISDFWSPNCERIKFWLVKTIYFIVDFPVAQTVKNLPGMQETRVPSLAQEDPLEKEWQSTPIFLLREFHGWRSLAGFSSWGHEEWDTTE